MGDEFKDADVDKPIFVVTGGKVVDENGNRFWWPDDDDAFVEAKTLSGDWQDVGYISADKVEGFKPVTLSVKATGIGPEALSALFGFDGSKSAPTAHSVVIDTTDTVSGAPQFPVLPVLDQPWWQWRKRREVVQLREDLIRAWEIEYASWVRDGKPDREVVVRRYIPNARIDIQED